MTPRKVYDRAYFERWYRGVLDWALGHRVATLGIAFMAFAMSCGFGQQLGLTQVQLV